MILAISLALLGVYLTAYVAYQLFLFSANALIAEPPPFAPARQRRFTVLVPAHDEELFVGRLISSLAVQEYPKDRYEIVVIADNCTDGTAAVARSAGANVLERRDATDRGKGQAIRWALERIDLPGTDAVVIVDGDTLVEAAFLRELNLQMERGDRVIQCYNGVANPQQSWFTGLMDVSRTMANDIVHPAKRKLGLSSHLMGNGMCFDARLLETHGWRAFSVGEDWEYYARLILSGLQVGYSRLARVYHQESVNLRQASPQRLRWSSGRFQVLRQYGPPLLWRGIRDRSITCVDAALPLVFPNPSLGINLTFVGLALAGVAWYLGGGVRWAAWFGGLAIAQLWMFVVGIWHTERRLANATALLLAPAFLAWKFGIDILSFCGVGTRSWKRTERRLS